MMVSSSCFCSSASFTFVHHANRSNGCCRHRHLALRPPTSPPSCVVGHHRMLHSFFTLTGVSRLVVPPHRLRSSSQGLSDELVDGPTFVPLNADDPRYGPPALLLLGFKLEETEKIKKLLDELDGGFLKIIHCTTEMIGCSLWEAINREQPILENIKVAKSLPRICFLSGLTGEEMMMFIDAFPETGLEPTLFAALVPKSANKPLEELIEDIVGDHEMLTANQSTPP
ncbi:uncharacterized protein LOC116265503 [Nymphaea colorata]|nr:uncharacterized protein LOC116265503 [Nymphaea colorata]